MQAYRAVVTQPGQIELEAHDLPLPAAGQVLLQTQATLISPGTERAFFLHLPNTTLPYPLYPGYSHIGQVVAVGDGVAESWLGQSVASTSPHASHVLVPIEKCRPVPQGLAADSAVFFNLIAIAMQAVHKARIELGEAVAVIGAGMIGLYAMQLAKINGGLPVGSVDSEAGRLEVARQVGADAVYLPTDLAAGQQDGAWPVVIEATGASPAILSAFQLAASGGRVILLGSSRGDTDGVNFYRDVHRKGLTIIGAHEITRPTHDNAPGRWTQVAEHRIALDLLAHGRLITQPLITHRFGWQDFPQAYGLLADWDLKALGMVIEWR